MGDKGQTAAEYLIIFAVVIIIALIVVGVLNGLPGLPNYIDYAKIGRQICAEGNLTYYSVSSDNVLECRQASLMDPHGHYNMSRSAHPSGSPAMLNVIDVQVDWAYYANLAAHKAK